MISKLFVYFIIFSCMGWIYESIYCTLNNHHWENRGFLFGPLCPIYGVGGVLCAMVCGDMFHEKMPWWEIFIVCYLGSIVLEYVTSYVLEKLFHAVWWDYSDEFMNIHGRVCLFASIGFGLAGILVTNVIYPFTAYALSWMNGPITEVFALIFMAILGADIALTVSALTSLMQNVQAVEAKVNAQMEEFYKGIENNYNDAKLSAAEKREELTASATETMSMLMNLGQKRALRNVKEFRYGGGRKTISDRLISIQKGIKKGAAVVKESAAVVKESAVEMKDSAVEKAQSLMNREKEE